ncbi:unnamed protein product [Cyclocybe aegerita]|uniref:Uncharacterized protein n=1 Tax=Cyclocybe aegerita TaxID=1973307 RepID=A0A8S0XJM7_CYCAE|nr:unnamed protein product [Cyclocybe aegerita]
MFGNTSLKKKRNIKKHSAHHDFLDVIGEQSTSLSGSSKCAKVDVTKQEADSNEANDGIQAGPPQAQCAPDKDVLKRVHKPQTQIRALPQLEDFITTLDVALPAKAEVLLLPSDFTADKHQTLGLTLLAKVEYQLWEGEANDTVSSLCSTILHGMVLLDAKKAHSHGVYQNTRSMCFIRSVQDKKKVWMAQYREAHRRLLSLADDEAEVASEFPELSEEDTFAKNAASAHKLKDGSNMDSWIWGFGRLHGMDEVQKADFLIQQEVELLEEEFRCLIRACCMMGTTWTTLASSISSKYAPDQKTLRIAQGSGLDQSSGYRAYAFQKAAMYQKMESVAHEHFAALDGEWPSEDETLSEMVMQLCPVTAVDWEDVCHEAAQAKAAAQAST